MGGSLGLFWGVSAASPWLAQALVSGKHGRYGKRFDVNMDEGISAVDESSSLL
jgi:hypothetical protein